MDDQTTTQERTGTGKTVAAKIDWELYDRVAKLSKETGRSVGTFVRLALKERIDAYEKAFLPAALEQQKKLAEAGIHLL